MNVPYKNTNRFVARFPLFPLSVIQKAFNDAIDELEDKVSELQKIVDYFKELWKKFIEFLQNKFFSTNKYDDFINDLYDEDILDDNEIIIIQNNKNIDKSDDFEK